MGDGKNGNIGGEMVEKRRSKPMKMKKYGEFRLSASSFFCIFIQLFCLQFTAFKKWVLCIEIGSQRFVGEIGIVQRREIGDWRDEWFMGIR